MSDVLERSELLTGLDPAHVARLAAIAEHQSLAADEYLFLLGESADRLFVVLDGKLEVCFPLSFRGTMKDVAVETKEPGSALGWSALVKPYRFTLSARAAEPSEVACFARKELSALLEEDCQIGQAFIARIAEMVGRRFLTMQALWARELQRTIAGGLPGVPAESR